MVIGYESISDIDFPAVTFCTRTNSKYAITERIGNALNLDSGFTKKYILPLRNEIIEYDVDDDSSSPEYSYFSDCLGDEKYKHQKFEEHCKV